MKRYIHVYKHKLFLLLITIVFIVISTVTKGITSRVFAIIAGIAMIYGAISLTLWIIKTPGKKDKDSYD